MKAGSVALGLMVLVGCLSATGAERELRPLVVLSGSNSGVTKPECLRVASQEEWAAAWRRHAATQPKSAHGFGSHQMPAVDFTQCMVIVVFGGSTCNTDGLRVVASSDKGDEVVVGMDWMTYQTRGDGDKVTPFAFIVLPLSRKPILTQLDTRDLRERVDGRPPKWQEHCRFPMLEK